MKISGKIRHLEKFPCRKIYRLETEVRFSHTNKTCDRQTSNTSDGSHTDTLLTEDIAI